MPNDRVSIAGLTAVSNSGKLRLPPLPEALSARLAECHSLPSLPAAAARLIAIARSSDPRLTDYARAIDQDPALTLRLLAVANSPFYLRDGGTVSTSDEAVSRLGVDATMGVALSFGLPRSANHAGINHQYFCQRAIIAASAAQGLAKYLCPNQAMPLFTSALLQDIGILALEALDGTDYSTLLPQLHPHQYLCEIEHARYGCDHALVGAWLAISWGVPSSLANNILASHTPLTDTDPAKLCLALSSRIAECWLAADSAAAFRALLQELAAGASIDIVRLMKVMQEIQDQLPSLSRLFDITCPPAIDSVSLLDEAKHLLFEQSLAINQRLVEQRRELEALHARHMALDAKHRTDHLTQLANRSWIERQLTQYFDDAKQAQQPLSVVFIDLDHFKQINDRFGHRFGDKVLVQFAATLKHMIRENDLAGRYGGEEFLVILPNTRRCQANILANRIRQHLQQHALIEANGKPLYITASIGIVDSTEGTFSSAAALVDAADQAMYRIKHAGRDGVAHYEESGPSP